MYLRKLIHLSMGFFALTLKWMTPWQALLCALIAFAHNVFIFPLYGRKKIEKDEEVKKGYTGITSYPAVVFFLILFSFVFNSARVNSLTIAAMAWAVLAFGDSLSALTGMAIKGSKLPWNKNKTVAGFVAFIVFGAVASYLMAVYFNNDFYSNNYLISIILLSSVIAGIVESIDGQFDDNLGFPFVAFSILSFIIYPSLNKDDLYFSHLQSSEISEWFYFVLAFLFNIILAFTALKKKWVSMQGFLFGMLIGFSVIISLGYKGFLVLCLFYIFANFSTFYKSKIKEDRGIAESDHGRRGLESVFSKGIAPAVFCWLSVESFIASLAFYAADTVATEIGKTNKGKTFSIVSFKKVNSGTAGGVSLKGSVAGIFSIAVFLLVSSTMLKNLSIYQLSGLAITLTVFFFLESIVNDLNAKFQVTSKIVIHIVLGFLAGSFSNAIRVYLK